MGETISIEAELMNLKEVSPGDSIYDVNSASRWNSLRRLIIALASGQNIKRGANMLKKTGPTWCVLSAIDQGGSDPVAPNLEPFECRNGGKKPSEGAQTHAKVDVKKGTVNDLDDAGDLTVTGGETGAPEDGGPPDGFWTFAIPASTSTYLMEKATIETDGTVSSGEIYLDPSPATTDAGDPDTGEPPPFAYRKIAYLQTDSEFKLTITQYTKGAQQAVVTVSDWACSTITKNVFWLP